MTTTNKTRHTDDIKIEEQHHEEKEDDDDEEEDDYDEEENYDIEGEGGTV